MPSRRILPVLCTALLAATTVRCAKDLDLAPVPGKGGALTGRIVTRQALTGDLQPAPGATLEFLRGGPHAVAGEDGQFAVRPPAAPWQLLIRDGCNEDGTLCARQKLIGSSEVPVDPDVDYSLGDLVVADNGEIRGKVRLSDRQAGFGGVTAYVPGAPFRAVSGDDGTFVLQHVPEGTLAVGFFLSGYEPVSRTGVVVAPASSTVLAEVELVATPPANVTATIHGHVTRADGAPGDVHIEALRQGDASPAGVLDVRADEDFALSPLPLGLYAVTVEAEGYGRAVLHNLLMHQDVSLDLNLGTVVVPSTFEPVGGGGSGGSGGGGSGGSGGIGGSGGMGGSPPPPTCEDDPAVRGPCFLDWSPPTDDVLPAMGIVTLHVDKPLLADTVSVLFRSSIGAVVEGVSTYLPPALGIGGGGSGGAAGEAYGRIEFRPSRPLSAGTWTVLLSSEVRDTDGFPAPQVGPTWLVTGVEAGPAVSGASRLDAPTYGVYPSLATNAFEQTWLAFGQPGAAGTGTDYFESMLDPGQAPYVYTLFSTPREYYEVPLRLVSSASNEALLVDFAACRTGGYAPRVARNTIWSPAFGKPLPDCSTVLAVTRSEPLAIVGWQDDLARFVVSKGDELAMSTTYGTPFEAGTHYYGPLQVFDVPAAEGPRGALGPARRLLAAVRTDPLFSRTLDVMELEQDGSLSSLPGVVLSGGIPEGLTGDVLGCGAGGLPLLVYTVSNGREETLARAALHDGVKWIPIAPPSNDAGFRPVQCVTQGETPILFWTDYPNLKAAYLVLDRSAPERSRWVQIGDRRQATGALNVSEASCSVYEADAVLQPGGSGLLFAYHQYCSATQTAYGELRFGRLY